MFMSKYTATLKLNSRKEWHTRIFLLLLKKSVNYSMSSREFLQPYLSDVFTFWPLMPPQKHWPLPLQMQP